MVDYAEDSVLEGRDNYKYSRMYSKKHSKEACYVKGLAEEDNKQTQGGYVKHTQGSYGKQAQGS